MMRRAQPLLGTLVDISIADALDASSMRIAFEAAFSAIARVHGLMSFHEPASDVSRINRAIAGEIVEVNCGTHDVIRCALSLSTASEGIFDIACASRLVEWGYLPSPGGNGADVTCTGMLAVDEDRRIRKLHSGWIDLGGIAKGYAVDAAIDALASMGVESACVNAGGDLRVLGSAPYEVSIRDPHDPASIAMRKAVGDGALATSGAYFTRKQCGGVLRSALIDGRQGEAITRDFSVSVLAPQCMIADALTKVVAATADVHHPLLAQYEASAFII